MKNLILVAIFVISGWAVDYSQMSTEELSALRGSIVEEDREAFRSEMQKRVEAMTAEERVTFRSQHPMKKINANKNMQQKRVKQLDRVKGQGEQIRQRLQDGSGSSKQEEKGQKGETPNNGGKKGKN